MGSAGTHVSLVLRDWYVYGSLSPFSLEAMMKQRKEKMMQKAGGVEPTEEEVCLALVESSMKSNAAWDKSVQEQEGIGYARETWMFYLPLTLAAYAAVYLAEVIGMYSRRKKNED